MTDQLTVIANDQIMGYMECGPNIKLTFTYTDEWRESGQNFPLSLSMPLAVKKHQSDIVNAFLWGLLPDNEHVLSQWAKKFQVSAKNPFKLISHVGEDCAGAIQFVPSEKVETTLKGSGDIEWLSDSDIASRLLQLRQDHSATRAPRDNGQFSLAGAQPKTALALVAGRWGLPSGNFPTTHILKPPTGEFDGFAENEHFCLELARSLGLIVAKSQVMDFEGEKAIVVERYDRRKIRNNIFRIHQEDFCQALGISPFAKYQNEGGPDAIDCLSLIKQYSSNRQADIERFHKALIFNWLIGGTDAHAKNYSMLLGRNGQVRLAPLYDISSALPYPDIQLQKMKLAMKVGSKYKLQDIDISQWEKFWVASDFDTSSGKEIIAELINALPQKHNEVQDMIQKSGLKHPIITNLQDVLEKRCKELRKGA